MLRFSSCQSTGKASGSKGVRFLWTVESRVSFKVYGWGKASFIYGRQRILEDSRIVFGVEEQAFSNRIRDDCYDTKNK